MKLKLVVVDFELPVRVRKWSVRLGIPLAVMLAGGAVAHAAGWVTWGPGQLLTADDLNGNFKIIGDQVNAIGTAWSSYTPTTSSDGTVASVSVHGNQVRYLRFGSTVCLQGQISYGFVLSGSSGTFLKVSLPPGLPGKTGVKQYGIGSVSSAFGVAAGAAVHSYQGAGAIIDDLNNLVLLKGPSDNFTNADAALGYGIVFVLNGCYETD